MWAITLFSAGCHTAENVINVFVERHIYAKPIKRQLAMEHYWMALVDFLIQRGQFGSLVHLDLGVWEGLNSDMKGAVQKAADETGAACSAKSAELASWYFEQLEANGMAVEDASPEFLAELQAIGAKMTADWLASAGADGQAILDAYKSN